MSAIIELEDRKERITAKDFNGYVERHYLFTVDVYEEMIEKGILTTEHKIELLNGRLYEKYTGEFYKIPIEIYEAMVDEGILTENDNYELLDGKILEKMPKGTKHCNYNDVIARFFYKNLDEECVIRNQNPIRLPDFTEPEPDIVLAKLPREKYLENHPEPPDILIVIEIADSTLRFDRHAKGAMYAEAGIVQYLVIDVQNKLIEDYREPFAGDYQTKQTYKIGDKFSLVEFPNAEIAVKDFFES